MATKKTKDETATTYKTGFSVDLPGGEKAPPDALFRLSNSFLDHAQRKDIAKWLRETAKAVERKDCELAPLFVSKYYCR
ncbi:MAG: hypothetical protein ABH877_01750 [bacterium]